MDYEKKYKEALERARKSYVNSIEQGWTCDKVIYEEIFPELKESEDEKIRKQILSFLKEFEYDHYRNLDFSSWIAWLEKQGDTFTKKDIDDAYLRGICDARHELEKQGEQKPVDKVEPKFNISDWVLWDNKIYCYVDNIYQGKKSLMYTITDTNNMTRSYSVKGFDNNAHLWTIQDAKDGDVLLFEGYYNSIVLFQVIGINGKERINYHCKCDLGNYSFGIQGDVACLGTIEKDAEHYHPATKEQRDFLFKKMKEAGYEWDAEKKELKKIEHKPAFPSFDEAQGTVIVEKVR